MGREERRVDDDEEQEEGDSSERRDVTRGPFEAVFARFFPFPSSLMSFRRSIHAFAALPHIRFGGQLGDVIVPSSEVVPLPAKNIPGRGEVEICHLLRFNPGKKGSPCDCPFH